MTKTYEEFIALKIKEMDVYIAVLFNEYETKTDVFHFQRDNTIENTEEWFNDYFFNFIYRDENIQWINEYQLVPLDTINAFKFKEQLVRDYIYDVTYIQPDEEEANNLLKIEINNNFINNYIINILDFEYFKNLLYNHNIYPDVFAEEVELK